MEKITLFEAEEECSCGGKTKVSGMEAYSVRAQVKEWRDTHKCHNRPVEEKVDE